MPRAILTGRDLSIREHLLEFRKRLTRSALVVLLTTGIAFAFHKQILELLMKPAQGFNVMGGKPIYIDLTELIGTAMKSSLLVGIFASLPFVLYQIVMFVAPGLTGREKRYLYSLMPATLISFVLGAAFGYFVLFPPAVKFLLSFGQELATPQIRIGSYISLMLSLLFWMGIVFQTPVILFFLSKIGIVTPEFLAKQRRYAIVIAFVLGAAITPTFDPVNQSIVAIPIILLYELGIWLARIGRLGKNKSLKRQNGE